MPLTHIKDYIVKCRKSNIPDQAIIANLRKANWPDDIIGRAIKEADAIVKAAQPQIMQNPAANDLGFLNNTGKSPGLAENSLNASQSISGINGADSPNGLRNISINYADKGSGPENSSAINSSSINNPNEPAGQNPDLNSKNPNLNLNNSTGQNNNISKETGNIVLQKASSHESEYSSQTAKNINSNNINPDSANFSNAPNLNKPNLNNSPNNAINNPASQSNYILDRGLSQSSEPKKKFSAQAIIALVLSPLPFIGLGVSMNAMETIKKNNNSGYFLALIALLINIAVILFLLYAILTIFTLSPDQLTGFSKFINDNLNLI